MHLINNSSFAAQTVYDDNYQENPNYVQGRKYLETSQYSSAIVEFKKALRENPNDYSTIVALSNAYNGRAVYYNNTAKNTQKAANDLRSAIFYTKYFNTTQSSSLQNSINAMETNLKALLESMGYSSAPFSCPIPAEPSNPVPAPAFRHPTVPTFSTIPR